MPNPDAIERIAPGLATLTHPGDEHTEAFPMYLSVFQTALLPETMVDEMAEDMGMPSPDIAKHFLEALSHLADTLGYEAFTPKDELAGLRAAAAVNEGKRNEIKVFKGKSGRVLFRAMVRDFDTSSPTIMGDEDALIAAARDGAS